MNKKEFSIGKELLTHYPKIFYSLSFIFVSSFIIGIISLFVRDTNTANSFYLIQLMLSIIFVPLAMLSTSKTCSFVYILIPISWTLTYPIFYFFNGVNPTLVFICFWTIGFFYFKEVMSSIDKILIRIEEDSKSKRTRVE